MDPPTVDEPAETPAGLADALRRYDAELISLPTLISYVRMIAAGETAAWDDDGQPHTCPLPVGHDNGIHEPHGA